jgi:Na+-translocating ferredoxin:NAD+ oxidoreductase subunit C
VSTTARFSGGTHPKSQKNTQSCPTVTLDDFATIRIPMIMHNGPPSVCLVKAGDTVEIGQLIGRADSAMAVPIHASISGKVRAVADEVASTGQLMTVVTIDNDRRKTVHDSVTRPVVESRDDFVRAIRDAGLVGLGGAGFPTYLKMKPPAGKEPDTLVINAAECEPYVTSDCRLCIENPAEIIEGIDRVLHYMNIPRAIIGIEGNKPEAVESLRHALADRQARSGPDPAISINVLPTIYPQGAEKMLIYSLTGRKVPSGGLPHDVHVMVLNVGTARYIASYLKTGMPLVRRIVTVDGGVVRKPGNFDVPTGVPIADLVEACGGFTGEPGKVIMGGPMMGVAVDRTSASVLKINNAILMLDQQEARIPDESACFRCARCVMACPMNLMPTTLDSYAREQDVDGLNSYHVMDCIECGCCSFVCPAKRFLVQSIRNGKLAARAAKAKEGAPK